MSGKYINFKALTKIETAAGWDEEDLWLIFGDQKNDKNYYMSDEVFAQILIDKGLIPPGPIINTSFNIITGTTVQAVFNSIDSNFGITNAAVALNLLNINNNTSAIESNGTNISTAQTTANNAFGLATSNQTAIGSIVSANGSVTTHNDVTNAGSGSIISTAERNNIAGSVTAHSDVSNAGSGAIISVGERSAISTNLAKISADGSISTHSDVTYNSLTPGEILIWSGTEWLNGAAPTTNTTNVTSAGALMDNEVTNLAQIKAFDSADYEPAKGVDDNFVTDAQLVTIGNTSGINTGDQDLSGKQDVLLSVGSPLSATGSVSTLEVSGISLITTVSGAVNIIVDDAGGNPVSIGTEFKVFHVDGANALTFSISGSQAIISVGSSLTSAGIGARMTLTKYAANSWLLSGDI